MKEYFKWTLPEEREYNMKLLLGKDLTDGIVFENMTENIYAGMVKECIDLYKKVSVQHDVEFPYGDDDLTDSYIYHSLGFKTASLSSAGPGYILFRKKFNENVYADLERRDSFDYEFKIVQTIDGEPKWLCNRTITSKKELFKMLQGFISDVKKIYNVYTERLDAYNDLISKIGPVYDYELVKVRIN